MLICGESFSEFGCWKNSDCPVRYFLTLKNQQLWNGRRTNAATLLLLMLLLSWSKHFWWMKHWFADWWVGEEVILTLYLVIASGLRWSNQRPAPMQSFFFRLIPNLTKVEPRERKNTVFIEKPKWIMWLKQVFRLARKWIDFWMELTKSRTFLNVGSSYETRAAKKGEGKGRGENNLKT